MRTAIALSVIPGLLAAVAIIYAIRSAPKLTARERTRLRMVVRAVLRGSLGRLLGASAAFEVRPHTRWFELPRGQESGSSAAGWKPAGEHRDHRRNGY